MSHKSVDQVAENIRNMVTAWHAAQCAEEQWRVESQMGEEVFRSIFAEDTTILGPWHLRAKGKRKEEKYEHFMTRWEALRSSEDLGIDSKDLLAWCRCVGLRRLMKEQGLDSAGLSWLGLCEIQRLKSVNHMIEKAREASEEFRQRGIPTQSVGTQAAAATCSGNTSQVHVPAESSASSQAVDVENQETQSDPQPQALEPVAEDEATLGGLERLLEHPKKLFANAGYVQMMEDPVQFKDLTSLQREQLRVRVEEMARELESFARKYRDFEAVLRWSRRF